MAKRAARGKRSATANKPRAGGGSAALRRQAFAVIRTRSFKKGRFVLASGKESDYFLDLKSSMMHPKGAAAIARLLHRALAKEAVDYVGGLAMGAVPLVAMIGLLSAATRRPLPAFFVRKEIKDHGTKKKIDGLADGESLAGKRVAIIEDVTTTGGSAMMAVNAATDAGAKVVLVLSVIDREEGAAKFYAEQKLPFRALFTAREFMAA